METICEEIVSFCHKNTYKESLKYVGEKIDRYGELCRRNEQGGIEGFHQGNFEGDNRKLSGRLGENKEIFSEIEERLQEMIKQNVLLLNLIEAQNENLNRT